MHCLSVSLAQGGDGLGAMCGREKALERLGKAGFEDIRIHQLEHDIQNDYYCDPETVVGGLYARRNFTCLRFHALGSLTTLREMFEIERLSEKGVNYSP